MSEGFLIYFNTEFKEWFPYLGFQDALSLEHWTFFHGPTDKGVIGLLHRPEIEKLILEEVK